MICVIIVLIDVFLEIWVIFDVGRSVMWIFGGLLVEFLIKILIEVCMVKGWLLRLFVFIMIWYGFLLL